MLWTHKSQMKQGRLCFVLFISLTIDIKKIPLAVHANSFPIHKVANLTAITLCIWYGSANKWVAYTIPVNFDSYN